MKDNTPPIIIVSGGFGVSAELLVNTVLAQFPESDVEIIAKTYVLRPEELAPILDLAAGGGGTLVHTLIDPKMRDALVEGAHARGVAEIDLTSALIERISDVLGAQPLGRPGRYRELRQDYFDRIAAIEYTIAKDDGVSPDDWPEADIVLVGLSRVGKTPLSMYLAVNGWKVANVPIVHGIPIPDALHQLDRQRLFGLILDHEELLKHRRERQRGLGVAGGAYANERQVFEEVEWARKSLRRVCASTHNVSHKAIESTAGEIMRIMQTRFGDAARR